MTDLSYSIRPTRLSDAEAIARCLIASWRTTYALFLDRSFFDHLEQDLDQQVARQHIRLADPHCLSWVAVTHDDHVIGFIQAGPNRTPNDYHDTEFYALYLLSGWRGQGIGRHLLALEAAALIQKGLRSPMVWVLSQNPYAVFYQQLGARSYRRTTIQLDQKTVEQTAYGWDTWQQLTFPNLNVKP